jgi:hypothetical protein
LERLLEPDAITDDVKAGRGSGVQRATRVLSAPLESTGHSAQQLGCVERLELQGQLAAVGSRDQQEVFGELPEPVGFFR